MSKAREVLHIALLRGINVGGNKKVPMADLREVAAGLGWSQVATYIQSGNVVFAASGKPAALEAAIEKAIGARFCKGALTAGVGKALAPYCTQSERVVVRDGALWIDHENGVARSKPTPAVLDRVVGSTVTLRNWKTVQALAAMVDGAEGG